MSNQATPTSRAIKFTGILGVLVVMALTNPSEEKCHAAYGDRYQSRINLIVCSLINIAPTREEFMQWTKEHPKEQAFLAPGHVSIGVFGQVL